MKGRGHCTSTAIPRHPVHWGDRELSGFVRLDDDFEGIADEDRHPGRRIRDAYQRGKPSNAQADDRDRGEAHSLAHHEHLRYPGMKEFIIAAGY
jgi:hypothetical protein